MKRQIIILNTKGENMSAIKKPGTGQEDSGGYTQSVKGTIKTSKDGGRTRTGSVSASGGLTTGTKDGRGQSMPTKGGKRSTGQEDGGGGYVPPMGKR